MTSAVVPVLSAYRAKGDDAEFWKASQAVFTRLVFFLLALAVGGVWLAPVIVRVTAPGFADDPEKLALTVRLARLLFPLICLIGVWAYFMGLLNSLHHFAIPALGPSVLNLAMLVACIWFVPLASPGILAVAIGVMVGGVLQAAMQVPPAMLRGFRFRWRWTHPGASEVLRLLGPRFIGSAVYQLNVLIDTVLASWSAVAGQGAVAALYFANRLIQLPMGLFGVSSAQASLPSLAEQAAAKDRRGFHETMVSVIRMVGFIVLPSSVALIVLAFPIVSRLFERGAFDRHSTVMTAQVLAMAALGLWGISANKVLTGAFYAWRDTRTPVKLAFEAVLVNVLLSLALMWPLQVSGLALAASVTNTLNSYRLASRMERLLELPIIVPVAASLLRVALASGLMGVSCWTAWEWWCATLPSWIGLGVVVLLGMASYAAACWMLRVPELSTMVRWLGRAPWLKRFVNA
jgi:putative peptidoglycan lipid II flippase